MNNKETTEMNMTEMNTNARPTWGPNFNGLTPHERNAFYLGRYMGAADRLHRATERARWGQEPSKTLAMRLCRTAYSYPNLAFERVAPVAESDLARLNALNHR